jgi:hypothetical protein
MHLPVEIEQEGRAKKSSLEIQAHTHAGSRSHAPHRHAPYLTNLEFINQICQSFKNIFSLIINQPTAIFFSHNKSANNTLS